MAIYVNGTKLENTYFNGTKLDRVYVNNTLVYESTIYIAKPTVTGAYTFNTATQSAVISGYSSSQVTVSGTLSAKSAGTYHVYFEPKKGYAWKDGTTSKLDYTWTIAKRSITIPSLSATSFVWLEGSSHSVVVKNIDTGYVTQSGTLYQTDTSANIGKANTVTWALKYPSDTKWTDNTNANKSASWSAKWTDGTSHYKNDIYNRGWNSGLLAYARYNYETGSTIDYGSTSQPYIKITHDSTTIDSVKSVLYVKNTGYLLNARWDFEFSKKADACAQGLYTERASGKFVTSDYDNSEAELTDVISGTVYGTAMDKPTGVYYYPCFSFANYNTTCKITRIYHT